MPNRRPRLSIVAPSASPAEAAAVVAAIERFLRDLAPAPALARPQHEPWIRAALLEGVGLELGEPSPWATAHPSGQQAGRGLIS